MKTLVIYDSAYGNTEQIAKAIGGAINGNTKVLRISEVTPVELKGLDLLIVGSPTQGGRPTKPIQDLLASVPEGAFKGMNVAAFDTRFSTKLVGIFGYAAGKIGDSLKKKEGNLKAPPEAFFVKGSKGPLKEGEIERAAKWAKELAGQQAGVK
jgi:flavodoxin I